MAKTKSIVDEARQIALATELIQLDARLQVLESEVHLSRERLLKLYKELKGKSPPKGMLPFSTDWFMTWQPNIHSSLFMNIYRQIMNATEIEPIEAIIRAFRLYRDQVAAVGMPDVLSITRAWRLVKFFEANMLAMTQCRECEGHYVVHPYDLTDRYVCGLCHMPSRAGKTRQALFSNDELAAH
ncbi:flagellar transcriptional regulator FlhC [Parvibium lacunae]|uniref:Flagellar transcriptional regulator FlhC n=1 Tax=Parvibium lacunae TaxID=1888893 RepID=A0A368L8A7_9BURK|nr:flagellar transcriptional regulator FlhC [Parvibium lacunae]RCS59895.1 flagellar transcriptional regulator FlhC [Parvibium lacunae]